ncbi:hypothetical protein GQR58_018340 [Nymphon striatum]|nr:hypothetical protein GQR58_018340 [Nymphon striatum]
MRRSQPRRQRPTNTERSCLRTATAAQGKDIDTSDLSWDDWDEFKSPRPDTNKFDAAVDRAISRRGFLGGALAFGSGAAVMGAGLLKSTAAQAQGAAFKFTPVGIATDFDIHVPDGYVWKTLVRWGDPLFSDATSAYSPVGGVDLAQSERIFGENTDGMTPVDTVNNCGSGTTLWGALSTKMPK